jgi:hypothetical protein
MPNTTIQLHLQEMEEKRGKVKAKEEINLEMDNKIAVKQV